MPISATVSAVKWSSWKSRHRQLAGRPAGGLDGELAHVGVAAEHGGQQDQAGGVGAGGRGEGGQGGTDAEATENDPAGAGGIAQPVCGGVDTVLPGGPVGAFGNVTGVTDAGVVETQGRIAGGGEGVGQKAHRMVGVERVARQGGAEKDGYVTAGCRAGVQPAEAVADCDRCHAPMLVVHLRD